MNAVRLSVALLIVSALPAFADPCDDLLRTVEGALADPATPAAEKQQLESLLNVGRTAKSAGNTVACQQAMDGALQSPAPAAPGGLGGPGGFGGPEKRDCESTRDQTV